MVFYSSVKFFIFFLIRKGKKKIISSFLTLSLPLFLLLYVIFYSNQVSATRKGFKNQIKNLWWRKGKDEIPDSSNGQMYAAVNYFTCYHTLITLPLSPNLVSKLLLKVHI